MAKAQIAKDVEDLIEYKKKLLNEIAEIESKQ